MLNSSVDFWAIQLLPNQGVNSFSAGILGMVLRRGRAGVRQSLKLLISNISMKNLSNMICSNVSLRVDGPGKTSNDNIKTPGGGGQLSARVWPGRRRGSGAARRPAAAGPGRTSAAGTRRGGRPRRGRFHGQPRRWRGTGRPRWPSVGW